MARRPQTAPGVAIQRLDFRSLQGVKTTVSNDLSMRYAEFVTDRIDLRRRLHEVAFRQRGFFSAQQAKDVGYTYQAQKYHADRGNWTRVDRALFRLPGWPSAADDSLVRWSVWSEGAGVISHHSAAEVHGFGELDPAQVHVTMPAGFTTRNTLVSIHNSDLPTTDIDERDAFRVTTPARTIYDLGASDITQEQLDSAVRDALLTGAISPVAIRRRIDDFGDRAALRVERALNATRVED